MGLNFSKDFDSGAELFLQAMGIRDKQKQQEMMDKLHQAQLSQMDYKMKLGQTPVSQFMQPEMRDIPVAPFGEGQGMFPVGTNRQEPTGRQTFTPPPNMTLDQIESFSKAKELMNPKLNKWEPTTREEWESSKRFESGLPKQDSNTTETEVAMLPDDDPRKVRWLATKQTLQGSVLGSEIGKMQLDKDKLLKQGIPPNHPAIQAIDRAMGIRSGAELTEAQKESNRIREDEGKENRELRKEMFEQNISLRRDFLDLSKNKFTRLPPSVQKDLNDKSNEVSRYMNVMSSFKDEFAGGVGGLPFGGGIRTMVGERTGIEKARTDWWKNWMQMDTQVRHGWFGAQFSPTEKAIWDKITVNENSDPDVIRNAMQTRLKISSDVLNRHIEGFSEAGYDVNVTNPNQQNQPKSGLIHYEDGQDEFFIPKHLEDSFLQKHPKARRVK